MSKIYGWTNGTIVQLPHLQIYSLSVGDQVDLEKGLSVAQGIVTNQLSVEQMYVSNALSIAGNVLVQSEISIQGMTTLGQGLSIFGWTTLSNGLSVYGSATFSQHLQVNGPSEMSDVKSDGLLSIHGSTYVSDLYVRGTLSLSSGIDSTQISGNILSVGEESVLNDVHVRGSLSVGNVTYLKGSVQIQNTLSIQGDTYIEGNLNVLGTGTQTFINTENLTVNDNLIVLANGNSVADMIPIGMVGMYEDGSSVKYTGVIRNPIDKSWWFAQGMPDASGNLSNATMRASITVGQVNADVIDVSNHAIVNGALSVSSLIVAESSLIKGSMMVQNGLSVMGTTTINGSLSVSTHATFGNVITSGVLSLSGIQYLNNQLSVSGLTTLVNSGNEILLCNNANGTNVLLVDATGRVGVRTSTPEATLDVKTGAFIVDTEANNYGGVKIDTDSTGDYNANFRMGRGGANDGFRWYLNSRPSNGGSFGTGNLRMTLTGTGNLIVNGSISSNGVVGKNYPVSGVVTAGTGVYHTGMAPERATIYSLLFRANPNNGGSGEYMSVYEGRVSINTGWNGSAVTTYINYSSIVSASNAGSLTITPYFYNGSNYFSSVEYSNISSYTIAIQVSGYNSDWTNSNEDLRLTKLF